ncbi:uncharacterized protein LOC106093902 [Stomoxys calcitrans]|uniref:uncharacterized protein LOC106093902 n=1 Tax=Stomoxys calcitrans TaxID=35570 RepID=UPI0027E34B36|nr:uncharacterized protein LOC106093902 [Stomoxys calcitrans]XP_059218383.1 uncharacterized protein LOC106093902 [Stomoxys calcitrans]XP_059218384.1 uncharacterized protein LOC106093902 [Stomoxys calcitrans]
MITFSAISIVRSNIMRYFICLFIIIVAKSSFCNGHGRLIEPPSRASAWRYGFSTPPDYNDHELYCGGFTRQWKRNGGKCGECGDAWDMPEPRPHEHGGQWGQGVIVRRYSPGAEMTIRVELTASHMGYFEFRLCPEAKAKQDCLDQNVLTLKSGSPAQPAPGDLATRFYPRNGSRIYEMKAQLPDMTCHQCVLQWRYIAGNNWGICPDGNGAVGCGEQEEFRSCADIALGEDSQTPMRPVRPSVRTTKRPAVTESTATQPTHHDTPTEPFNYVPLLLLLIVILLLLCIFAIWYLNRQNNPIIAKCKDYFHQRICKKSTPIVSASKKSSLPAIISHLPLYGFLKPGQQHQLASGPETAPVPPPRTRRNRNISLGESSAA